MNLLKSWLTNPSTTATGPNWPSEMRGQRERSGSPFFRVLADQSPDRLNPTF
jgi:hypothetical protein